MLFYLNELYLHLVSCSASFHIFNLKNLQTQTLCWESFVFTNPLRFLGLSRNVVALHVFCNVYTRSTVALPLVMGLGSILFASLCRVVYTNILNTVVDDNLTTVPFGDVTNTILSPLHPKFLTHTSRVFEDLLE